MDLLTGLTGRRSIRHYTEQTVSGQEITKILETARFAPSWKNSQTAKYYAILNPELKNQIAEQGTLNFSKNKYNIQNAPALIVLTSVGNVSGYNPDGSFTTSKNTHWESFDAGIAAQTFCLSAYANGFGTLIMGIFDEQKIAEILGLPENESVSALIALGHA
ncbi:MAG: nitroreductase family protein, partial [Oscillospiraceae bacterium]|nr:nitroreductase family protein [Oscillospiraceae bacterium]